MMTYGSMVLDFMDHIFRLKIENKNPLSNKGLKSLLYKCLGKINCIWAM